MALVGAVAPAAGAEARTIQPLSSSRDAVPSLGLRLYRDRIIHREPVAFSAVAGPRLVTRGYRVPGGGVVRITVSSSFPDNAQNRAAARSFATFLGSRRHRTEISRLRVFIGTPAEISAICAGGDGAVLACYSATQQRMFVPDRDPPGGGPFTREYAVTHEYGHHIAANRTNAPFRALNYGAKYWASYKHICARARSGQVSPGNQGARYLEDPGEGFADTYAHLHYPSVAWQFADILRPDAGAFAAVRRDVSFPWRGPRRGLHAGSLGARPARTFAVRQSLDGSLSFRLSGPANANYDLQMVHRGKVVRQTTAPGSRDVMTLVSCRSPDVRVAGFGIRVLRRSGAGRFSLRSSVVG